MPTTTKSPMKKSSRSGHLAAVPNRADGQPGRTAAEIRLWDVLATLKDASAAELAERAEVGRSTATKILSRWHEQGLTARTAGGVINGRRLPDTWARERPEASDEPGTPAPQSRRQRLPKGALRGMVEDFLSEPERVGKDYTPGDVARVLGHSAGAISNALDRLVEHGTVQRTSAKPRKFRLVEEATHA